MKLNIMEKDSFWCYSCNYTQQIHRFYKMKSFSQFPQIDKNYLRHITSTTTICNMSRSECICTMTLTLALKVKVTLCSLWLILLCIGTIALIFQRVDYLVHIPKSTNYETLFARYFDLMHLHYYLVFLP